MRSVFFTSIKQVEHSQKPSGFKWPKIIAPYININKQIPVGAEGFIHFVHPSAARTGSLNHLRSTGGLSNTAARASFEGPLSQGSGSWLLSARRSYMNLVDWFNNRNLIAWGLDNRFLKEDFVYTHHISEISDEPDQDFIIRPFANHNRVLHLKARQWFDLDYNSDWHFTAGVTANYYKTEYFEDSHTHPLHEWNSQTLQTDFFLQSDWTPFRPLNVQLGNRLHWYRDGNRLRWSPRIKMILFPDRAVTLTGGYSRNHQFLHHITLQTACQKCG
jgi:hypothetical protein